jgi:hypothetical protein
VNERRGWILKGGWIVLENDLNWSGWGNGCREG